MYEDLGFNEDLASRLMIAALALVCGGGVAYFEWKKFKPAQSGSAPLSCQFNRGRHVTSWMARCFAYSSVASGVFALTLLGAKKVYAWQWGSWLPIALGSIFGVSSATVFGFADIGKDLRCHDLEDTQNPPYNKVRQYKDQLSFYQDVILRSLTEPVLMSIAFLLKGPNVLYGILLLPMVWATEYTVFEIKRSWGQIEDHHSKVVELRGHAQAEQESNEQGQVPASPRSAQAFLDAKEQEALVASKGIRGGHAHSFSHPGEYTDLADKVRQDDVMAFFVTG
ncbi:MAG: hypothetical protein EBX40_03580 [Gammaproteobacteria bacterium]|nr:hypothetical protein [Gammaproteobacteria bacterium]